MAHYEVTNSDTFLLSLKGLNQVRLNAGDTLQIRVFHSRSASIDILASTVFNIVTVNRIAGPEAVGAGELVQLNAAKTAGTQTSTGAFQDVASWTTELDTNAAFNATTGVFTVPVAGSYSVQGTLGYTTNTTGVRGVQIRQNSTTRYEAMVAANPLGVFDTTVPFNRVLRCNAGDTISLRGFQSSGGNLNYSPNVGYTVLSITKVG